MEMVIVIDPESIRKKWLRSWKVIFGYNAVAGVLFLVLGITSGWEGTETAPGLITALWSMLWLAFCHQCACEKPGTKLLTSVLVASSLCMTSRLGALVSIHIDIPSIVDFAISLTLFIWFMNTSVKLRYLNKQIQKQNRAKPNLSTPSGEPHNALEGAELTGKEPS
jgi:hypothetical protein